MKLTIQVFVFFFTFLLGSQTYALTEAKSTVEINSAIETLETQLRLAKKTEDNRYILDLFAFTSVGLMLSDYTISSYIDYKKLGHELVLQSEKSKEKIQKAYESIKNNKKALLELAFEELIEGQKVAQEFTEKISQLKHSAGLSIPEAATQLNKFAHIRHTELPQLKAFMLEGYLFKVTEKAERISTNLAQLQHEVFRESPGKELDQFISSIEYLIVKPTNGSTEHIPVSVKEAYEALTLESEVRTLITQLDAVRPGNSTAALRAAVTYERIQKHLSHLESQERFNQVVYNTKQALNEVQVVPLNFFRFIMKNPKTVRASFVGSMTVLTVYFLYYLSHGQDVFVVTEENKNNLEQMISKLKTQLNTFDTVLK